MTFCDDRPSMHRWVAALGAVCEGGPIVESFLDACRMKLPNGYSEIPAGKVAAVVTCLEMQARVESRGERGEVPWQLRPVLRAKTSWYRELYRQVGTEWLWHSRLVMPEVELDAILRSPAVEVYALNWQDRDEGLLELDFREEGQCELAFFGLTAALQGRGAGRWLMNRAIELAWTRPIRRFWVHTCTLDHPDALRFYMRSGFRAYARRVEVVDDPRLTGHVPRAAALHVPIIDSER